MISRPRHDTRRYDPRQGDFARLIPHREAQREEELQLPKGVTQPCKADSTLVEAPARAFRWKRMLEPGEFATIAELAEREGIAPSHDPRPAPHPHCARHCGGDQGRQTGTAGVTRARVRAVSIGVGTAAEALSRLACAIRSAPPFPMPRRSFTAPAIRFSFSIFQDRLTAMRPRKADRPTMAQATQCREHASRKRHAFLDAENHIRATLHQWIGPGASLIPELQPRGPVQRPYGRQGS